MKKTYLLALFICISIVANAQSWTYLGTPGFSDSLVGGVQTAIDKNGTVYVAYVDYSEVPFNPAISVKKFDGTNWQYVGLPRFDVADTWADEMDLAIDKNGTPYVALSSDINSYKASVLKFNGTSWVPVGSYGFTQSTVSEISIAIDTNLTPYVVFKDDAVQNKTSVMKFDGNGWVYVGGAGIANLTQNTSTNIVIAPNNTPYVAITDYLTNNSQLHVMSFNGTSWIDVPGGELINHSVYEPHIAFDKNNSELYVVYSNFQTDRLCVKKHNGTAWVAVGQSDFSAGGALKNTIVIDSQGKPIVASRSFDGVVAWKFNGSTWTTVGQVAFTTYDAYNPELVIDQNNTLFLGYEDLFHNNKASVMTFGSPSSIWDNTSEIDVVVCPNPSKSMVYIKTVENVDINTQIVDINGKIVVESKECQLNINLLPAGVYSVLITTKNGRVAKRLVKL